MLTAAPSWCIVRPMEHPIHPAADIFPAMSSEEFDGLAADIREHGLREAIVLHDGAILDGRNRYRACRQIGIEPRFEEWDGEGTPEAYVVSKNLHRRHLNESQRAMIAHRLATAKAGERTDLRQIGTRSLTIAETAQMLNVGDRTVRAARTVDTEGTPEEIAAVEQGKAAASTIAKQIHSRLSPDERKKKRGEPIAHVGKNPERIQRAQINGEIWGRVRDALTHLTSLPMPADVVAIARAYDKTGLVDDRLARALNYLKEFDREWTRDSDEASAA